MNFIETHNSYKKLRQKNIAYKIMRLYIQYSTIDNFIMLLLFAMIRSVVKSFKVPGVEVVASRMSNEAALTRMIDSTPKKLGHT